MQEIIQLWRKNKRVESKFQTVKQSKKKSNCRDEKKDVLELSLKMGMDSETLREENSLRRTVGLKRVTKISYLPR